jgi:hypothetical protein
MNSMANFMMQDALEQEIGYVFYLFLTNVNSRITSLGFMGGQKIRLFSRCYPKLLSFLLIKRL